VRGSLCPRLADRSAQPISLGQGFAFSFVVNVIYHVVFQSIEKRNGVGFNIFGRFSDSGVEICLQISTLLHF
jgi:hypothetical protein